MLVIKVGVILHTFSPIMRLGIVPWKVLLTKLHKEAQDR